MMLCFTGCFSVSPVVVAQPLCLLLWLEPSHLLGHCSNTGTVCDPKLLRHCQKSHHTTMLKERQKLIMVMHYLVVVLLLLLLFYM